MKSILEDKGKCVVGNEESHIDTPRRGYQETTAGSWGMVCMCAWWIQNDKDYRRMSVMGITGIGGVRWIWGNLLYNLYILGHRTMVRYWRGQDRAMSGCEQLV